MSAAGSLVPDHYPEGVYFEEDAWKIVCRCAWECWDIEEEERAWELFNDHIFDEVGTALRKMRDSAKVVYE